MADFIDNNDDNIDELANALEEVALQPNEGDVINEQRNKYFADVPAVYNGWKTQSYGRAKRLNNKLRDGKVLKAYQQDWLNDYNTDIRNKYLDVPAVYTGENTPSYTRASNLNNHLNNGEVLKAYQQDWLNDYNTYIRNKYFDVPAVYTGVNTPSYTRASTLNNHLNNGEVLKAYQQDWLNDYNTDIRNKYLDDVPAVYTGNKTPSYNRASTLNNHLNNGKVLKAYQQEWLNNYNESRKQHYIEKYVARQTKWDDTVTNSAIQESRDKAHWIRRKIEYFFATLQERHWVTNYNENRTNREQAKNSENSWHYREDEIEVPANFEGDLILVPIEPKYGIFTTKFWERILRYGLARDNNIGPDYRNTYYGNILGTSEENQQRLNKWLDDYYADRAEKSGNDNV